MSNWIHNSCHAHRARARIVSYPAPRNHDNLNLSYGVTHHCEKALKQLRMWIKYKHFYVASMLSFRLFAAVV